MTPEEAAKRALISVACYAPHGGHSLEQCQKCRAEVKVAQAIREAVKDEREACATIAEEQWAHMSSFGSPYVEAHQSACRAAADAIRSRTGD